MKKKNIKFGINDLLHLAKLSQLSLDEQEMNKLKSQLKETLEYITNLNELETSKVPPTDQVNFQNNIFFEDGAINERHLTTEEIFQNTKNRKDNYFIVKRIL